MFANKDLIDYDEDQDDRPGRIQKGQHIAREAPWSIQSSPAAREIRDWTLFCLLRLKVTMPD